MRKIIVLQFMTLDGVVQAPGGPEEDTLGGFKYGGWTVPYFDDFAGNLMGEQMSKPLALLLGRVTYEIFASYWPTHESNWPGVNAATKYVASRTPLNLTWENSVQLGSDIVAELKKIKAADGPDLQVHGSAHFIQTLLKHDLVDELWLKIFPITLGTGKRLFADLPADATHQALQAGGTIPTAFKLTDSKVSPKGVIFANYERAGDVETGTFAE